MALLITRTIGERLKNSSFTTGFVLEDVFIIELFRMLCFSFQTIEKRKEKKKGKKRIDSEIGKEEADN